MQENGSENVPSTMPEELRRPPQGAKRRKPEGPIETGGATPTPDDKNQISPP